MYQRDSAKPESADSQVAQELGTLNKALTGLENINQKLEERLLNVTLPKPAERSTTEPEVPEEILVTLAAQIREERRRVMAVADYLEHLIERLRN